MPRTAVLVEFDELVYFAQDELGYNFNDAWRFLELLKPANGESTCRVRFSNYVSNKRIDENMWRNDDETKIVVSYMVYYNLGNFEVVEGD